MGKELNLDEICLIGIKVIDINFKSLSKTMKKRVYTYKKPTKEEKSRADWVKEGENNARLLELRSLDEKNKKENNKKSLR